MSRLALSNLHIRPNLLSEQHYQQEMMRCSVFELRNINERNPGLVPNPMPSGRQQEWRDSLFWGDSPPPPVAPAWAENLAGELSEAVRNLEVRPTLEAAFECLVLARLLYHARPDELAKEEAAELDRRVCLVLARNEFRHSPDVIDQRVESILGYKLTAPARPAVTLAMPPARPAATVERPRQQVLFPALNRSGAKQAPESLAAFAGPANPDFTEPPMIPVPTGGELPSAGLPRTVTAPPVTTSASRPTTSVTIRDPNLKRLIHRWATLPDHVKKCVMMLLEAADSTQPPTE